MELGWRRLGGWQVRQGLLRTTSIRLVAIPQLSRARQTGTSSGRRLLAGIEPLLGLVVGARSDRQVRSTQPDPIVVRGQPSGLVEKGADGFDRSGLPGKLDMLPNAV